MGAGNREQLLQSKMAEIRRYLIRLGAGNADAEDIVQDTVYKALLYIDGIEEHKFSAWLYIEGVPVPWNEKLFNYNDGQKEMAYYIPGVEYDSSILNDLNLLTAMEPDELAEMALSFDQPYSFEEVNRMLPKEARPVWYWVDTYDDSSGFYLKPHESRDGVMISPQPVSSSSSIYGFGTGPNDNGGEVSPEDFLGLLQSGLEHKDNYYSEYSRISRYLKKDKAEPDAADVRILGVVVTGSAAGLKSLNGQPYIRGAVLGAVADPY